MLENFPVGQITQDEAPDSLYVPTAQEEHESAPSSDHSPAEHTKQEDEEKVAEGATSGSGWSRVD